VGRCYGNPLMPDMIKARKDIAATHKKRTRFQSTPGHFKGIGRNLSIPNWRNAALHVPIIRSLEEDNGRSNRV